MTSGMRSPKNCTKFSACVQSHAHTLIGGTKKVLRYDIVVICSHPH